MDTPGFKTILCPVDFGELSAHALRHANLVAGCGNAKVIAVYANWFEAPAYFTAGRVENLQKQYREALGEAERSLRAFVDSTLGESEGKVVTRVVEALPADGIHPVSIVALTVEFYLAGETAIGVDKVSASEDHAGDKPHQPNLEAVKRRRRVVNGQTKRGIGVRWQHVGISPEGGAGQHPEDEQAGAQKGIKSSTQAAQSSHADKAYDRQEWENVTPRVSNKTTFQMRLNAETGERAQAHPDQENPPDRLGEAARAALDRSFCL